MSQLNHGAQFLQKRKFLLTAPLLVLPFITIIFWLLGGGKASGSSSENPRAQGMNIRLPDAHFKKGKDRSKLSLYEEAGKDSALFLEKIKNDPYYSTELNSKKLSDSGRNRNMNPDFSRGSMDENEARVMEKLEKLKSVLDQKGSRPIQESKSGFSSEGKEVERQNLSLLREPAESRVHDPQLDQLNTMLDKVMAIQHPEMMRDSLSRMETEHTPAAYEVKVNDPDIQPSAFGKQEQIVNRFYDLTDEVSVNNATDNAIEAVIPETQTLVSGSTIKFRLLNDIQINGVMVPKNEFIYGTANLSGERMKVQFSSIRSGNNILPVALEAYDQDGLAGIFIPGSMNREVARQSGDQAIGTIGLTSIDPSLGAQAAGAGIQAAKSLLSHKIKLIKVTVPQGYRVLLRDPHQK